tara:strand:- start:133 stop:507 length:375 start_codon:yes stop_codon:yes gene_type:complete
VQLRRHATASTPYTPIGFLILVLQNLTHLLIAPFCELLLTLREGGRLRAGSVVDGLLLLRNRILQIRGCCPKEHGRNAGRTSGFDCLPESWHIYRVCWHGGEQLELRASLSRHLSRLLARRPAA